MNHKEDRNEDEANANSERNKQPRGRSGYLLPLLMAWTQSLEWPLSVTVRISPRRLLFLDPRLISRLHQLHSFSWPLTPRDMDVFLLQWIFRGLSVPLFLLYLHLYRSWLCNFQMYIFNSSPLAGPEFWLRKSWVSFHTRYQTTCLFYQ